MAERAIPISRKGVLVPSAVVSLALYCWIRVPPPTVADQANSFVRAFQTRDAWRLSSFCSSSELDHVGVKRSDLEKLISEEVFPVLNDRYDLSRTIVSPYQDRVEVYFAPKKGSTLLFGNLFIFTLGSDGPVIVSYISSLFRMQGTKYFNPKIPTQVVRWEIMNRQSEEAGQRFRLLGFNGIYSTLTNRVETWDERKAESAAKIRELSVPKVSSIK